MPSKAELVSILIQPEDRMQALADDDDALRFSLVSILIQPEDRMQGKLYGRNACIQIVSILIQPEDRMQATTCRIVPSLYPGFNPHPARRPDASLGLGAFLAKLFNVSILIQPEDGCKILVSMDGVFTFVFQSSSSPKTGCKQPQIRFHRRG